MLASPQALRTFAMAALRSAVLMPDQAVPALSLACDLKSILRLPGRLVSVTYGRSPIIPIKFRTATITERQLWTIILPAVAV